MTSNTVKKNVMLTLTIEEAAKIGRFIDDRPYISIAKYLKMLFIGKIDEIAKNEKTESAKKTPDEID